MLGNNLTAKKNPYLVTTLVTVSYIVGISIAKYALGRQFDLAEALVGAVIFWVIYFLIQCWLTKRLEKKNKQQ